MFLDAEDFAEGADGIVFGFLNPDHTIDEGMTEKMVDLIHSFGKTAVFHRAFDNTRDGDEAIRALIRCHVDRVLTSGQKETCLLGADMIKHLIDSIWRFHRDSSRSWASARQCPRSACVYGSNQVHLSARTSLR